MGVHLQPTTERDRMKQDIHLLAETLEEAYKALQQGDKDIALACIAYAQTIINGTNREV